MKLKSFLGLLFSFLIFSASIPIGFSDSVIKSCEEIRPTKVLYCSKPLEIIERSENYLCCGDGSNFAWETSPECSDGKDVYEASYCRPHEEEIITSTESCMRKCSLDSYTNNEFDPVNKVCMCWTPEETDDYQYYFYIDKNSETDLKLEIKTGSQMKEYSFIQKLFPGNFVQDDDDKRTINVLDKGSFVVHGKGGKLDIKKDDYFTEPINILPYERCDELAGMMYFSELSSTDDYIQEKFDADISDISFGATVAGALYTESIRPDALTEGSMEVAEKINVYKAFKNSDGDMNLELVGIYNSFREAIDAARLNPKAPWETDIESGAIYASEIDSPKTNTIIDINDYCIRSESQIEFPKGKEMEQLLFLLQENELVYSGDFIHTHPSGTLTLSKGDIVSFGKHLKEADSFYPLPYGKLTVLDPSTGDYKIYFLDIDEVIKEYYLYMLKANNLLKGLSEEVMRQEIIRILNEDVPINVYKYEITIKKSTAPEVSQEILEMIRIDGYMRKLIEHRKLAKALQIEYRYLYFEVKEKWGEFGQIPDNEWNKILNEIDSIRLEIIEIRHDVETIGRLTSSEVVSDESIRITNELHKTLNHMSEVLIERSGTVHKLALDPKTFDEMEASQMQSKKQMIEYMKEHNQKLINKLSDLEDHGIIVNERPMFKESVVDATDELSESMDAVIPLMKQDTLEVTREALTKARNSMFRGKLDSVTDIIIKTAALGDVLETLGVVTTSYGNYIDDARVANLGRLIWIVGTGSELLSAGIAISTAIRMSMMAASLGIIISTNSVLKLASGFVTGTLSGMLVSLVVSTAAYKMICYAEPESPYCGCSVHPYYGSNPVIEIEKTTVKRNENIDYVIYGMQYCYPGDFFGNKFYLFNLFTEQKGFIKTPIGEDIIRCQFEDGTCCGGSVSFNVDEGEYDIFGSLMWVPHESPEATTDTIKITVSGEYEPTIMSLSLKEGWNLVSTPYLYTEFDTSDCKLFPKAFYYQETGYKQIDTENILAGKSYWILSYNDCSIKLKNSYGNIPEQKLSVGWNQVAVPLEGTNILYLKCDLIEDPKTWDSSLNGWVYVEELLPGKSYFVDCRNI